MSCPRCHGLMVRDMCWDLEEIQGMWIHTTRCMNCGHVSEPTMDKHRLQTSTAERSAEVVSVMRFRHAMEAWDEGVEPERECA